MKKSLLCSLICLSLLGFASTSHAQVKIGTVDMNKIFSSYYKTKDAEARINEDRNSAKQDLDERMDTYKKNLDAITKLNEDIAKPELSAEASARNCSARRFFLRCGRTRRSPRMSCSAITAILSVTKPCSMPSTVSTG